MENRKNQALELKNDGDKLYQKQLFEEALKLYLQAIELDPLQIDTYLNISKSFIKLGKIDKAVKFFEKSIKISSNDQQVNLRKGISGVFFGSKYYKQSCEIFEPVYKQDKNEQHTQIILRYAIASNDFEKSNKIIAEKITFQPDIYDNIINDNLIPDTTKQKFLQNQKTIIPKIKEQTKKQTKKISELLKQRKNFLSKGWKKN